MENEQPFQELETNEKESWINFHEYAYKDDLKHAEETLLKFPRWSIISAYYAMHDITKLFIGKIHNKKIAGEHIHDKTIIALKTLMKDENQKTIVLQLLKEAQINFYNAIRLKEKVIPLLLSTGKRERGKAQYYSSDSKIKEFTIQRAVFFIEEIAKPFIKLMEELLRF